MTELTATQYATLAWRKVEVARRHLIELERELPKARVFDPASPTDSRAAVEGHADGCVLQAYAAFDTFACAVARHFGMAQPDRASLNGLVGRLSEPSPPFAVEEMEAVRDAIRSVTSSEGWNDLSFYRNLAGHRGVVAQRAHFNPDDGFTLRIGDLGGPDPDWTEVLPILRRIVEWTEDALRGLRDLAEDW